MEMTMADNILPNMGLDAWDNRAQSEINFWRNWVRSGGGRWPEDFERRTDPTTPLNEAIQAQLDDMAFDRTKVAEVLDIGSGPLSLLGYSSPDKVVNLTLVDPLAKAYNAILDEAGISGVPRPQEGYFETTLGQLGKDRFHVVWCRNALDHSIDPLLGLYNLIAMCTPGGRLILSFHPNEADTGNYQGLHQWNLNKQNDKILLAQKGLELDLSQLLSQQEILSVSQKGNYGDDKGDVTVVLRKTCDPNLSQAMMQALAP
jgi:2-polyprenyl-3-methyl-5-hydroxy-6-metoxy-1,4-benzoquinol methylase